MVYKCRAVTTVAKSIGRNCRTFSTIKKAKASDAYFEPISNATSTSPELSEKHRAIVDRAIRVDQAGEVAANWIYKGQMVILKNHQEAGPIIQAMWEQEKKHLAVMNKLQLQHNTRPTVLWEVAKTFGFGLGVVTALMGKEAAMACTEAVETTIGEHYDEQLKELENVPSSHSSIPLFQEIIKEFRDDELEHLDTAVAHDAQRAPAHALLSTVIAAGCKTAIELCKRI